MDQFQGYFGHHSFGFWVAMLLAVVVALAWIAATRLRLRSLQQRFEASLGQVEGNNVPTMLTDYLSTVRQISAQTTQMGERVNYLYQALPGLVRHVGLVRFSPFHDTGGDQSFSLALLDSRGDGVVLSALHSRQDAKLYAKPLRNRTSEYALTEEEKRAIADSAGAET